MDPIGELKEGRVVGRDYRIERPLASGGMGAVYVATQLSTGKRRALKVLYPQFVRTDADRRRFEQEARIGAEVDSDHVVEVVGAGVDDDTGTPWLAMELLDGEDLATFVRSRAPLDLATVRAVMEQLCDALACAHAKGVVHRDLKPENVFMATPRRRGVPFTLKILDFGIAKIVQQSRAAATGSVTIGTPLWMAPEQAVTAAPISPATDVWSLGLIAYWLLTGNWYWSSAQGASFNLPALLVEVMTAPLDPASVRAGASGARHALPWGFDAWFARCVSRDPTGRFASAAAAYEAFSPLLGGVQGIAQTVPLSAPPGIPLSTTPTRRTVPPVVKRDHPAFVDKRTTLLAVALVAGASFIGGILLVRGRSTAETAPQTELPTLVHTSVAPAPTNVPVAAETMLPSVARGRPATPRPAALRPGVMAPQNPGSAVGNNLGSGGEIVRERPIPETTSMWGRGEIVRERVIRGNASLGGGDSTGGAGEIDAGRVASLIRGQLGGIRSCYERALRNQPALAGRIDVSFTISESGRATSVSPSGMSEAPEVGTCIAGAIRRIAFPQPTGGTVQFSFPFTFSLGG